MATRDQTRETGPWDAALAQIREWDPEWADTCAKMTTNPWSSAVLPRKTVELISLAINAACTNLNPDGTRRHIRAALEAGATREENPDAAEDGLGHVDPFVQPGRAD